MFLAVVTGGATLNAINKYYFIMLLFCFLFWSGLRIFPGYATIDEEKRKII